MAWFRVAIFPFFLTACSLNAPHFVQPQKVQLNGQSYEMVTDNRLDHLRQSLYLPSNSSRNPDDWQQGILLFSEEGKTVQSLAERVRFRQDFAKKKGTHSQIALVDNQGVEQELRSEAIHPPTARFQNVQLEVTRGRNSACGYSQIQFAKKEPVRKQTSDLTAFQSQLTELAQLLAALPWQMECQK
ncbi:hypothetical protein A4G19_15350 [Pasteurellaceae bacterium Macca]|nr:hypothetical protein [Pasteurellaceae bacterium Macca]